MTKKLRVTFAGILCVVVAAVLLGCENMSVGFGYSTYDPGTGMGYSMGVSRGPYGQTHSSYGMSMYGHP